MRRHGRGSVEASTSAETTSTSRVGETVPTPSSASAPAATTRFHVEVGDEDGVATEVRASLAGPRAQCAVDAYRDAPLLSDAQALLLAAEENHGDA